MSEYMARRCELLLRAYDLAYNAIMATLLSFLNAPTSYFQMDLFSSRPARSELLLLRVTENPSVHVRIKAQH